MRPQLRVMVVDDDRVSRLSTAQQLQNRGYEAEAVENPFLGLKRLQEDTFDVVLTDMRMPGMSGIEFLKKILTSFPDVNVILMTAFATVETAVEAMQEGAVDYLVKPFRLEELDHRLGKLVELKSARSEIEALHRILDDSIGAHGMVGRSPILTEVYERIDMFADHAAPVLITGETGTGKELVARALHDGSARKKAPFVPISCGTIPDDLAESELFGHERGAFTGAHKRREGSFERANAGTALLDDIDDLPLNIQVKLLRVLQEGTLTRVGGSGEISVDVRIVATSKVELSRAVSEGRFRDDLFYRLRGLEIHLPPLKERGEDILLLSQHFLKTVAAREGKEPPGLSVAAAELLRTYPWPGNVRELRRALESAFILCRGEEIQPNHLPFLDPNPVDIDGMSSRLFTLNLEGCESLNFTQLVKQFEDALSLWALAKAEGQQSRAAEFLGLPRTTFQSKLGKQP
ncbi:MAG: sigma-54-dependent transcriptional regulator [Planctomycetota bacterium]